ncbi:hypothetical protein V8E53_011646, partial [Lactarius tabidus]
MLPHEYQGVHKLTVVDVRKPVLDPLGATGALRNASDEHLLGRGMSDQRGNRASPAFLPAAQQDLITLTPEILARDPVPNPATSQREALRDADTDTDAGATTVSAPYLALAQTQAADSSRWLSARWDPWLRVSDSLIDERPVPYDDPPPPQILESQIVPAAVTTEYPEDHSVPAHAGSPQKPTPSPIAAGRDPATGKLGHL